MRAYTVTKTGQEAVDRNLQAIAAALADLRAAPAALAGAAVVVSLVSGTVGTELHNVYRGTGGHTLTLAGAAALGPGQARLCYITNDGPGTLTIGLGTGDSLTGSATVNTAVRALFISDGVSKWYRVV